MKAIAGLILMAILMQAEKGAALVICPNPQSPTECVTVVVPELKSNNYLVDPDKIAKNAHKPVNRELERFHQKYGIRIVIVINEKMPLQLRSILNFSSEKSAARMVGAHAKTWKLGTYGPGNSWVVYLSSADRGIAISAPPDSETRISVDFKKSPAAEQNFLNMKSLFFRVRSVAKNAGIKHPNTSALIAFVSMLERVVEAYSTPSSP